MNHFQGILLDLDNTVYCYEDAHLAGMSSFYLALNSRFDITAEKAKKAYDLARKKVNQHLQGTAASHSRMLYMQGVCELLKLNPLCYALWLYETYWDAFLETMQLYPHVTDFLQKCHSNNKSICLVTDLTAHIQYRKIIKLGLEQYISFMVTSEEVGHEKPHPKVFLTALKKLQLNCNQVIMIGDNIEKDILGAKQLGISAYRLSFDEECHNEMTTVNFETLIEMLI